MREPDLKPERGEEVELGFEAGLFNRVGIDFTVYSKQTKDAILLRGVPPSGGFPGEQFVNIGQVSNKGIELQVNAQPITNPNFSWDLGVQRGDRLQRDRGSGRNSQHQHLPAPEQMEGYPIASYFIKKVVSATADPDGTLTSALCDGGPGQAPVDCAAAPLVFAGTPIPKVAGAFTTTLTLFRNLRLYGLVDFKQGHKRFNTDKWIRCDVFANCEEAVTPAGRDPLAAGRHRVGRRSPDDQLVHRGRRLLQAAGDLGQLYPAGPVGRGDRGPARGRYRSPDVTCTPGPAIPGSTRSGRAPRDKRPRSTSSIRR